MTSRARNLQGLVLGNRWRVEGLLGEGGMGAVYRATHIRNGKRAALKLLHPELADADTLSRFQREGYLANLVDDPGVVAVFDDGATEDGAPYMVMELLAGESIEERAARQGDRLDWREVLAITHPALLVLEKAHAAGVIHRDLKPSNLFLTQEGRIKVLDFGLAGHRSSEAKRLTGPHAPTMGTLGFMPPEQASGAWDRVDARSDVWAMGATMYALLTGCCVHERGDEELFFNRILTADPAPIATVEPGIPEPVARLIDRAILRDPALRFQSAREMADAVAAAYHGLTGSDVTHVSSGPNRLAPRPAPDPLTRQASAPAVEATRRAAAGSQETLPSAAPVGKGATRSASGVIVPSRPAAGASRPPLLTARAWLAGGLAIAIALGLVLARSAWLADGRADRRTYASSSAPLAEIAMPRTEARPDPSQPPTIARPTVAPVMQPAPVASAAAAASSPARPGSQGTSPASSASAPTPAGTGSPAPVDFDQRF